MAPRMGVVTTAIAMTLTVILGLSVSKAYTTGDLDIGNFVADMTTSEQFTGVEATSETCTLNNADAVEITFVDDSATEIGTAKGTASISNCQTTVDANVTAQIKS